MRFKPSKENKIDTSMPKGVKLTIKYARISKHRNKLKNASSGF